MRRLGNAIGKLIGVLGVVVAGSCSEDRGDDTDPQGTPDASSGGDPADPLAPDAATPDAGAGLGGSADGGIGGATSSGGTLSLPSIGIACTSDSDCDAPNGFCASVESGLWVGGPAGGYCTAPCTAFATPDSCTAQNPNAGCIDIGADGEGYCILTCQQGQPFNLATKCHGRMDLVCDFISPETGGQRACLPRCGSDAHCPEGTRCNLIDGFCQSSPTPNDVLGQSCNPSVDTFCPCLSLDPEGPTATSTLGLCVGFCSLGAPVACGFDAVPRASVCLSGADGDGSGDLGLCLPSCNCNDDCPAGAVCQAADPATQLDFGSAGFCAPPTLPLLETDAGLSAEGIAICP